MKIKRLFLICFYFVAGLVFTGEVTVFDKLGATTSTEPTPTEHPNWETQK